MNKTRRTITLSKKLENFIEDHRGPFSFSAFIEHLAWIGIKSIKGEKEEGGYITINRTREKS